MKSELSISKDFTLPIDAVTQTIAILAKRGAGKTYTAMVIAEEMLKAGSHIAVIDPVGVWWGLRTSADGKRPGFPIVIFGGDKADVPLDPSSGELLAQILVKDRISAVVDLSMMRKGQQTTFMTAFAETLYRIKASGENRHPMHVFMDEADSYAPQRPMPGEQRMLGAIEDLVRRGRARGLGMTMITQRAAVLNKNVLTQAEAIIALRTISPQDHKAVDAWIELHGDKKRRDEMMTSLPSLPIGTAWFWSPGWMDVFRLVKIRKRTTFDSSATPDMDTVKTAKVTAVVDLEAIKQKLKASGKAVESKEAALERRIIELTRELGEKRKPEIREVPVVDMKTLRAIENGMETITNSVHNLAMMMKTFTAKVSGTVPKAVTSIPIIGKIPAPKVESNGELGGGPAKILRFMQERPMMKFTRTQLATLTGYTATGGTFLTYMGSLKRAGKIETEGNMVTLSDNAKPQRIRETTPEEMIEMWRGALRKTECEMFDVILSVRSITRAELAERLGRALAGGSFNTYIGTLRRNGIVKVHGDTIEIAI